MDDRNGVGYLAKNVALLTVSSFASKILVFFLVPLYTSVLTTEEYGTYDLLSTTVSLLVPLLTANIAEAVLRFALEDETDNKDVLAVGLRYTGVSILAVAVSAIALSLFHVGGTLEPWWPLTLALYAAQATLLLASNLARGMERVREVAVGGVIGSAVLIASNLILLLPLDMGLAGFLLANVLGSAAQTLYLVASTKMWSGASLCFRHNHALSHEMRSYGLPLVLNSVAWWVNGVSDRYVVSAFCGVAENGIYSVGSKIPSILNVLQGIFNQAWVLSAVRDVDANDSDGFFRRTYNAYSCLMVLSCSVLIVLDRPLAHLLYAADFYTAWRYVPFLMMAMVFGALSGHLGGAFVAAKDSVVYARSTVVGAVANIALNLTLVPSLGAMGAAWATTISYWLVWVLRRRGVHSYVRVRFQLIRDYLAFIILLAQGMFLLATPDEVPQLYVAEIVALPILALLYRNELRDLTGLVLRGAGRINSMCRERLNKEISGDENAEG